jgi:hypothetical protein
LSAVVDVVLVPGGRPSRDPIRAINVAHLYAVEWYARSIREAERGVGYGWSPLSGATVEALLPFYQSPRPSRPLDLCRRRDWPRFGAARRIAVRAPVPEGTLRLTARTPAAAVILHSVRGDCLVEFDIEVLAGDGNERVQIDVDAMDAFIAQALSGAEIGPIRHARRRWTGRTFADSSTHHHSPTGRRPLR